MLFVPRICATYCDERICMSVRLSVCPLAYHRNRMSKLHEIFCTYYLWQWLGRSLTTLQHLLYVRFSGLRHVFTWRATLAISTWTSLCSKYSQGGATLTLSSYVTTATCSPGRSLIFSTALCFGGVKLGKLTRRRYRII